MCRIEAGLFWESHSGNSNIGEIHCHYPRVSERLHQESKNVYDHCWFGMIQVCTRFYGKLARLLEER